MASFPSRTTWRGAALTVAVLGLAAAMLGGAVVRCGLYDVASTEQHLQLTHSLLETTMQASVRRQAAAIRAPAWNPARARRGAAIYAARCSGCHGGPGAAPQPYAMSMQPPPGTLIDAARKWRPAELYWITRHGVKMSGMPAWLFHLEERELWDVVAFVQWLPRLTPAGYQAALAGTAPGQVPLSVPLSVPPGAAPAGMHGPQAPAMPRATAPGIAPGPAAAGREALLPAPDGVASSPGPAGRQALLPDPRRGKQALTQYSCHACHVIPGITGSDVHIGPPLAGLASRALIAGKLPNTPDNLVRWIRTPQLFDPRTAMPAMGVPERDARDMAAYLATLD